MPHPTPGRIIRQDRRDLRESEDENKVEEQLERSNSLLTLNLPVTHSLTLPRTDRQRRPPERLSRCMSYSEVPQPDGPQPEPSPPPLPPTPAPVPPPAPAPSPVSGATVRAAAGDLALTFEIGRTASLVPGAQVDALLEQLDRLGDTPHRAEAISAATAIRRARDGTPSNALIEKRFAPALLAAIDNVERATAPSPETRALQTPHLAAIHGAEPPHGANVRGRLTPRRWAEG